MVCFVPRILVGVTPWLVYTLLQALSRRQGSVLQAGSMALSAVVGAFTNTALVMGLIALLFRDAYAAAQGIPVEAVLGFILASWRPTVCPSHCGGHPCPRSVHPHGKGSQAQPRSPGRPGARLSHAADH